MKHPDIEEHQVIDRYVMGQLPAEDAESFEEHYLSCPQCLDQLALAESMQRGFKRAAGQDAAALAVTRQLALFAWLSRLGRSRQAAVLAMALLVVVVAVLPGGLALRRLGEVDQELALARRALEQEKERAAAGTRGAADVEKLRTELDASHRALAQERQELAREQQARAEATERLEKARAPQPNVPIVYLGVERSSGSPTESPSQKLHRPPPGGWAVFSVLLDDSAARSYQATLRSSAGKEIWRGGGLLPNEAHEVNLSLPGNLLEPGDYTLTIEGAGSPASRFAFRVLPP